MPGFWQRNQNIEKAGARFFRYFYVEIFNLLVLKYFYYLQAITSLISTELNYKRLCTHSCKRIQNHQNILLERKFRQLWWSRRSLSKYPPMASFKTMKALIAIAIPWMIMALFPCKKGHFFLKKRRLISETGHSSTKTIS